MAEASPRVFQKGARELENGLFSASPQSLGWGDPASWKVPGANTVLPWMEFSNEITVNHVTDDSVTTNAAMSAPRLTGLRADQSLTYLARFKDIDDLNYWKFGFENVPQAVFVYTVDETLALPSPWGTAPPAVGTVFEDSSSSSFVFLREEPAKNGLGEAIRLYVFAGIVAPDTGEGAGTLNEDGGSAETFAYLTASLQKFEHLYELDGLGRRYRDYTVAEQITGFSAGDKKNIHMTFTKRFSSYDYRYGNAVCRSFTYSQPTEDVARWETNFLAFKQERSSAPGGFGSATWTLVADLEDNEGAPAHFQSTVHIGELAGVYNQDPALGLQLVCAADFSVGVEIPLSQNQDTCSGLHLAEPLLEGKYDISFNATILHHVDEHWQGYRDTNTRLFARFASYLGFDMLELLMKNVVLTGSGPNDDDIPPDTLEGKVSATNTGDDQWATSGWLEGNTQIQDMPLLMRVRNDSAVNQMFAN